MHVRMCVVLVLESLQFLPPELLQLCIQQLAQQALSMSTEGGLGEQGSTMTSDSNDSNATVGPLQQVYIMMI